MLTHFQGPPKEALYASGKTKTFTAELFNTEGFDDEGVCEHVADLITEREKIKKELIEKKKASLANAADGVVVSEKTKANNEGNKDFEMTSITTPVVKMLKMEDDRKYFMGAGMLFLFYLLLWSLVFSALDRFLFFWSHFYSLISA